MSIQIPQVTLNNGVEMPILGFGVFQIPPTDHRPSPTPSRPATATSTPPPPTATRRPSARHRRQRLPARTCSSPPSSGSSTHGRRVRRHQALLRPLPAATRPRLPRSVPDPPAARGLLQRVAGHAGAPGDGRVRAIGVANFHPDRLVDLIDHNDITPAVNQIETHPFHQRAADQELMRERGVQIESWGPFAEGRNNLFTDPLLSSIGEEHGKSVAQVVLRWLDPAGCRRHPEVRPPGADGGEPRHLRLHAHRGPDARSPRWTPAPGCSSTTATPSWSPGSAAACSTEPHRQSVP